MIAGWNGRIGGPRWWSRALSFALGLGVLLGIVGPFGSYLNGDVLVRIADWAGMLIIGTIVVGIVVPLGVRLGARAGLPSAFSLAVALLMAAIPICIVSAIVARLIWPRQTAALRAADWYGQTLLVEICVVGLWILFETARGSWRRLGPSPIAQTPAGRPPDEPPADPAGAILCLQMEDHYVRIHRPSGSTLELMTLQDAIARHGAGAGLQVHRSWWVAADAVDAAERDGRNWRLRLGNDLRVPIARNRIAKARALGWIKEADPA